MEIGGGEKDKKIMYGEEKRRKETAFTTSPG